ncbi:hypothetical protein [Amycolatopsis sp. cmx-4-61]|uniref:hypothetical protein n=1 Tax=Amycolatopsis sp. cmx-4-61 TaxID=2790937 RepID=UPI00397AB1E1
MTWVTEVAWPDAPAREINNGDHDLFADTDGIGYDSAPYPGSSEAYSNDGGANLSAPRVAGSTCTIHRSAAPTRAPTPLWRCYLWQMRLIGPMWTTLIAAREMSRIPQWTVSTVITARIIRRRNSSRL